MAYVLWRVFMKKYSKVRLGIHRSPAHVTPTGRQIRSFDDSSWKASEEVPSNVYQPPSVISVQPKSHKNDPPDDFSRTNEVRKSKTKRVKNYLKKCKNAIANSTLNRSQCSDESTSQQQQSTTTDDYTVCEGSKTSWYVKSDTQDVEIDISDNFMTVVTIDKSVCEFEKCTVAGVDNQIPVDACASEICAEELTNDCDDEAAVAEEPIERIDDEKQSTETSSLVLTQMQDNVEDVDVTSDESSGDTRGDCTIQTTVIENKNDVASLVDSLLGPIYPNFSQTRSVLVRQARDLLVCEYLGNIVQFEKEFCIPASILLKHVKQQAYHKNKRTEIVAATSDQQAEIKEKVDQTASSTSASQNNVTTDTVHDERVACAPDGWPLSLGSSGIILHLGSLAPALLRHGDCYVCIRGRSAPGLEVALVWRKYANIFYKTLAEYEHPLKDEESITCTGFESALSIEMAALDEPEGGVELPELLQTLLVSVERAIERIPLDDLAFPCPQCHQFLPLIERTEDLQENLTSCSCQCSCQMKDGCGNVLKKDTSMQTSPMFEIVGSIPHIDSDEDDEGKNQSSKSSPGSITKRPVEIIAPKNICELPEKFLMSGINLPGTHDVAGRPIVLCDAACIARAGLSRYDVTTLLLYYSSIPSAQKLQNGLTFLVLAETSEEAALDVLDKAMVVLTPHVNVDRFIIWRPSTEPKKNKSVKMLKFSKLNCYIVSDEAGLEEHIAKDQAPASCGGSSVHDQLEWVEFFKELEPFIAQCHMSGRALAASMSEIRSDDTPVQVTRRHLSHQHRQLTRALTNGDLQKLRREGFATLERLDERAQWLTGSEDVQTAKVRARRCLEEVHRVARRLEQIADQRRERLKELARLRALEEETTEVLQWLRNVGDEKLKTHNCLQRTAVVDQDSVKQQEQDFEQFYFIAMRYIDKGGDLIEEANQCADPRASNLKDMTQSLKLQLRTFGEALEETRERLEDTTRYFQLVDRTQNGPVTDNIRDECFSEMVKLAKKLGNDKMIDICETLMKNRRDEINNLNSLISSECPQHIEAVTSTPVQSTASQGRRRSVSSFAYIYKCNHHAAGFPCNCWDSDEGTISQKLKNTYVQSLQTQKCVCGRDNVIRQSSLGLGDIKEVRESAENLLDNENSGDDKNDSGLSGCGRCDSVSTRKTVSRNIVKKRLHRSCSCQYFGDMCTLCSGTESSSGSGSNGDHSDHQPDNITEGGSDGFHKSGSDELEDTEEAYRSKTIPPISVNSHLHCHSSNIHLPTESSGLPMDPKTHKTLLLIMREMIQTERDYVKSLDYIIENYIPELLREDIPQALRGQRNVVFGNVEKIYEFHSQHFLRELEQCAENPLQVGQCFLRHEKKFYLYALYNKNKPKSDSLMSEYGTIFFKAKQVELEDKMDLASYLLKPVQRMGKYALLLQQLMKACPPMPIPTVERDAVDMEDLKSAEQMVRFQLRHGNDLLAMDSLRDCDVNLKEQGRLLRQNEFLVWEGRGGKKSLRQVFLFEDLILFSKARRFPDRKNLDLYIYKNSIKMTDIGLTAKIGDSTTKFEIWFRKRKPNDTFTLQSMSEDIKKAWTEEISQLLWKQAMKNREVRLQEMSSMGIGNKPCLDIRPSADQISDRSISIAQLSKTAPKFRNSIAGPIIETCRSIKRPHSIISVSSVSSGSTSSGGSNGGTLSRHSVHNNVITYDPSTSPKSHHRSTTLNSQCSMESGIIADLSMGSDDCNELSGSHWPLQKSNSQHSNASSKSNTIASSPQTEEPQVTLYHVPDELSINL